MMYRSLGVDPARPAQRRWEAEHNGHRVVVRALGVDNGVTRFRVTLFDPKGKEVVSEDVDDGAFTLGRKFLEATE